MCFGLDNALARPGTGVAGVPSTYARGSGMNDEEDSVISKATTIQYTHPGTVCHKSWESDTVVFPDLCFVCTHSCRILTDILRKLQMKLWFSSLSQVLALDFSFLNLLFSPMSFFHLSFLMNT